MPADVIALLQYLFAEVLAETDAGVTDGVSRAPASRVSARTASVGRRQSSRSEGDEPTIPMSVEARLPHPEPVAR